MAEIDWQRVYDVSDWDHIVHIDANGVISEPGVYAAPVYWIDDHIELETSKEWRMRSFVMEFHPSEFFDPTHYRYHLKKWTDEGEPVSFYFTEIIDPDDIDSLIGWAFVIIDGGVLDTSR